MADNSAACHLKVGNCIPGLDTDVDIVFLTEAPFSRVMTSEFNSKVKVMLQG